MTPATGVPPECCPPIVPENSKKSWFLAINDSIDYIEYMANKATRSGTLIIRNIDPRLKEQLRVRAAHHGRSMEAELRHILADALADERSREPNLAEAIRRRFASMGGVELEAHPPVKVRRPSDFD